MVISFFTRMFLAIVYRPITTTLLLLGACFAQHQPCVAMKYYSEILLLWQF